MSLVSGYLLQGLIIRQEALPTHPFEILLNLLCCLLLADDVPPGTVGGYLQQFLRILLGGPSDGLYARPHRPCAPAVEILPLLGILRHPGNGDPIQQILWGYFPL